MQGDGVFTGAVLARPDEKGRLALPAVLRNSVPGEAKSRSIYISRHESAPCLVGSGADRRQRLQLYIDELENVAARRNKPFNPEAASRRLFGGEMIPIDGSGRFVMPDVLWEMGGFEGELFLLGRGEFFEIWDLGKLLAIEGEEYEGAKEFAAAAMRARDRAAARKGGKA